MKERLPASIWVFFTKILRGGGAKDSSKQTNFSKCLTFSGKTEKKNEEVFVSVTSRRLRYAVRKSSKNMVYEMLTPVDKWGNTC